MGVLMAGVLGSMCDEAGPGHGVLGGEAQPCFKVGEFRVGQGEPVEFGAHRALEPQ